MIGLKQIVLVLAISKTKSIVFGSRHRLVSKPKLGLSIFGEPIQLADKAKLLGLVLDSHLSWTDKLVKNT